MPFIHIANGTIEEITSNRGTMLVTVTYIGTFHNRREEDTVKLVVSSRTIVLNSNGVPVPASRLRVGMLINAAFSSAMTRSIPPQATAYIIEIVRRAVPEEENSIVNGTIMDIDRRNQSLTTISDGDFSSVIRFQVSDHTQIFDRFGRTIRFSRLSPGMQVWVRHTSFMTASIPPQTTALEIRVL